MSIEKVATARQNPSSTPPAPASGLTMNARRPLPGNDTGTDIVSRKQRIIRKCALTQAASQATHAALIEAGTIHRVGKGRVLLTQGEAASGLSLMSLGRVRIQRALGDGRTLALGYRGAGEIVGEAAVCGVAAHRESAIATEDVEAMVVPVAAMRQILAADPSLNAALLAMLAERQAEAEERLASLLYRNVEARLAEFLLKAAARWGIPDPRGVLVSAPFTHQEMASMIGSTRETVTLTLGDLKKRGIVDVDRRRIVILDREALRARVGGGLA